MSITGEPDGDPMKAGVALADVIAGKTPRSRSSGLCWPRPVADAAARCESRLLHVSLRGSATAALINVAQNTLVGGADAQRWGNAHPNLVPYQLFNARDRPARDRGRQRHAMEGRLRRARPRVTRRTTRARHQRRAGSRSGIAS